MKAILSHKMTLDKFGRHLVKNPHLLLHQFQSQSIQASTFMFYDQIITFKSNKILDNKYVLENDLTLYEFPLQNGIIEKIYINIENVLININENCMTGEQTIGYTLKENDQIAFQKINTNSEEEENKCLFVELVVKSPIKFEANSVTSENAKVIE